MKLFQQAEQKKHLHDNGIPVIGVDDVTGFPEILDGRVKTLNPFIHGGLLAKHDDASIKAQLEEHRIQPIQIVCVNLIRSSKQLKNQM